MYFSNPKEWYHAEYLAHFHPEYRGNPFVETIQPQYSEQEFLDYMSFTPELPSNLFEMPYQNAQIFIKQLERAYIPSGNDYEIYRHVYNEIITGYMHRNPVKHHYHAQMLKTAAGRKRYIPNPHQKKQISSGSCTLLSGLSGIGKTEKIKGILKMFDPVIRHTEYDGMPLIFDQVITVSFEISSVKSMKALALNFFKATDQLLNTEYHKKWHKSGKGPKAHLDEMQIAAQRHGIGLVHIDECQKLLAAAKNPDSPTVHYLESLFNSIGVPILMTCTEEGRDLFDTADTIDEKAAAKFQTSRRLTSSKDIQCSRMKPDGEDFKSFIDCFLPEYLFYGTPARTKHFASELYDMSQGIHQVLNKLLRAFLENIHRRKTVPKDYQNLLRNIYKSQFKLLDPALRAFNNAELQAEEMRKCAAKRNGTKADGKQTPKVPQTSVGNQVSARTLHTSKAGPILASDIEMGIADE